MTKRQIKSTNMVNPLASWHGKESPLEPAGCILVVGQNVWGRGATVEEARKKAGIKKRDRYLVYQCEDSTAEISDDGCILHTAGTVNLLVGKFDKGKNLLAAI